MNITVLGAGAWGTAVAVAAAQRHPTCLWARDAAQAHDIAAWRCNRRYLPEVALPPPLRVGSDLGAALAHAAAADGVLIVATPMAALRPMLAQLPAGMPAEAANALKRTRIRGVPINLRQDEGRPTSNYGGNERSADGERKFRKPRPDRR